MLNRFCRFAILPMSFSFALLGREEPEEHINLSSCDTCHDASPVGGTFLTLDFETGDPLVADQVYEFEVSVPGGVARPGISIRVADASTSDFVGTFVDGAGTPIGNLMGTTAVEAGKISETRLTGGTPQIYTYRWKAPAEGDLPEGVRIEFYRVTGNNNGADGDDGTDRRQLVLGDVSGGGGEEEEEELEQGAEQDTLGNSGGSGGAFGGDFGCSRSLAKSGFDLSFFIFLLFTLFGLRKHLQRRSVDTP